MSDTLRSRLVRLAHANPDLRPHLLPILAGDGTITASSKRTAGKVSVRFDNGLSVEDIEGMSRYSKANQS
ncbi:MAG: hypothetical protein EBT79_02405 [Actinobacteria bacterium]|nr:hypothetical protein [Actinomycetota bacterium]NBR66127.1 hypothetical protein [Actinomycetota bacterium]